ncbi:A/G-specific adenine glycosylase [Nocardioides sp. GCM10027113]|uniref:A/G-specific adenine glycosylase n=1 Tax=unclassified Nocardioides TaxID=2615069 RepID=UPI00361BB3E9
MTDPDGPPGPTALAHPVVDLHDRVLRWYDEHARDLPWRQPSATAWSVMVSEFMLQQTPVARVLPVHEAWLDRWPSPADLAPEPAGEAVRAWGRLGYPRRALRLHAAAGAIVRDHGGVVPADYDALRALPGVGDYTAAAVAVFAHGRRHAVLDTNVRRVHARVLDGVAHPPASVTRGERVRAEQLLPADDADAATWSVAVMELGALVCTSARPRCADCPVAGRCAWRAAGHPAYDGPPRRGQAWAGTDRQCRGRLLGVVRDAHAAVPAARLVEAWSDETQRERCLASLVDDGLLVPVEGNAYALP